MTVVLDASVILKWLLEDPTKEPDTEKAFALIDAVIHGKLEILQPVHWLIEVAAVAARLTPQTAVQDVEWLSAGTGCCGGTAKYLSMGGTGFRP